MRAIDCSSAFKQDYKREAKGQRRITLDDALRPVLVALATDQPLDARCRDHDLSGDWAGYRECHVKPDLLLIYRKSGSDTLRLARLALFWFNPVQRRTAGCRPYNLFANPIS
ncbi:MAG: type II toxin-antitoxin system YafQ family toxin [Betaproteobacteria bacterium]|nr:type II toxin-antitoxin system YafQ family toxin [Betaproteobacteria bacterium]